jgi:hypothetical protein
LSPAMVTKRTKTPVKKGEGGQSHESERPPLEREVCAYMDLEMQTKATKAARKRKAKKATGART